MPRGLMIALACIGLLLLCVFSVVGCVVHANNTCNTAEQGLEAQYQQDQNNYTKYFNKIQDIAQVPTMYVDDLKKLYDGAMTGRYGKDGSKAVVQFIREKNPKLDNKLYENIQQEMIAGRNEFEAEQKALIDKRRVYQEYLGSMPSGSLAHMFGWPHVDLTKYDIVISDQTAKDFASKRGGSISLRPRSQCERNAMTMSKKGSRTIRTDDHGNFGAAVLWGSNPKDYRWVCRAARDNPNVHGDVDVVIEEVAEEGLKPGRPLLAHVSDVETIDNGIIARIIKSARKAGWDPSGRKINYHFEFRFTGPGTVTSLRDFAKA